MLAPNRPRISLSVSVLLGLHAGLLVYQGLVHSPPIDEPAHLVAGLSHWEFGGYDLYRANPPLVRVLATLPLHLMQLEADWSGYDGSAGSRAEFDVARDFLQRHRDRAFWYVAIARWGLVPLSLMGGFVCWRWATELYGASAGLLALALWCFCPNVLANGALITPDLGATALGLAATYAFWLWLRDPCREWTLAAGGALGFAELTKFTWIVLFGLWPLLWIVWRIAYRERGVKPVQRALGGLALSEGISHAGGTDISRNRTERPGALQLAGILLIGLIVLNLGYGFEGTFQPLQDYRFVSRTLAGPPTFGNRFAQSWVGTVPVPLPRNYVMGIDTVKEAFEMNRPGYLRGEFKPGGWWYYYLYALAVKIPLGTWGLLMLALGSSAWNWRKRRLTDRHSDQTRIGPRGSNEPSVGWLDALVLLAPAGTLLVLLSANGGINRHFRYVLPVLPFAYIWISQVARGLCRQRAGVGEPEIKAENAESSPTSVSPTEPYRFVARSPRAGLASPVLQQSFKFLVMGAFGWAVASSLWVYPYCGSYFNELAGGPKNGHAHLLCSNIDWGQDLLFLRDWYRAHPEARPFHLAYYGPVDPRLAGIEFTLPPIGPRPDGHGSERVQGPPGPIPGWHAVSVHILRGSGSSVADGQGGYYQLDPFDYSYFLNFEPVAMAGYSIYVYHITQDEAERVRRDLGLPPLAQDSE
ncbi:MAG: ArnT family glycosyltransferase [Planctomycetales bacterium]